jgi:hypothetical protein
MTKAIKISVLALGLLTSFTSTQAQGLKDYMNDASRMLGGGKKKNDSKSITNTEIVAGLKEALDQGAKVATGTLAVKDGFFGNALVKVLMPPEAKKVENTLRQIGMGSYVDKAILSMNRAAEDASNQALPIFSNAIRNMTIMDALGILKGQNNAATEYLKGKTSPQLTAAFKPVIAASLEKVNATRYWKEVFEAYNSLPTTHNKINPDLSGYVTDRAIAGVFVYIAEEENKIRINPAARASDILKKVFGYGK